MCSPRKKREASTPPFLLYKLTDIIKSWLIPIPFYLFEDFIYSSSTGQIFILFQIGNIHFPLFSCIFFNSFSWLKWMIIFSWNTRYHLPCRIPSIHIVITFILLASLSLFLFQIHYTTIRITIQEKIRNIRKFYILIIFNRVQTNFKSPLSTTIHAVLSHLFVETQSRAIPSSKVNFKWPRILFHTM